MLLLALLPSQFTSLLELNRGAVAQGQYWRIVSGHFLHSNYWHLLLNLGGLLLVMLLHGQYFTQHRMLLLLTLSSALIGVAIYLFSPAIQIYVGLSGVLHALLCIGALIDIQRKEMTGYLLLAGLIIKAGYEQWYGADQQLAELISADVAIDAHLYGVITGFILWAMVTFLNNVKRS